MEHAFVVKTVTIFALENVSKKLLLLHQNAKMIAMQMSNQIKVKDTPTELEMEQVKVASERRKGQPN